MKTLSKCTSLNNVYNQYIASFLDIVVLAIVFYKTILVIKKTRAIQK
jgi:uncharacterized membrane protein